MKNNYLLTIAGSDVLSGGGFQTDLATFSAHQMFGFVAQTCMTAISEDGFQIYPTETALFQKQLESLAQVEFAAIKIGLLPTLEIAQLVLEFIKERPTVPVVLDPVLVFKENGDQFISRLSEFLTEFYPYVSLLTPNLAEAQILSDRKIEQVADLHSAALSILDSGAPAVIIKGGSRLSARMAIDVLVREDQELTLSMPLLDNVTNGAGCAFSAALTCHLAQGHSLATAFQESKAYVHSAIHHANKYGVSPYEFD